MGFKKFEHIRVLLGWGVHGDFVRFRLKRRCGAIITSVVAVSKDTIEHGDIGWVQPFMTGPDNTGEMSLPLFERMFHELALANVRAKDSQV